MVLKNAQARNTNTAPAVLGTRLYHASSILKLHQLTHRCLLQQCPSFASLFKSSTEPPNDDDLADLEESFHRSTFPSVVPSALSPSRVPSNTIIASSRAPFSERPVLLDFASGWAKGPVTDWYNKHKAKCTASKESPAPVLPRVYHIH